MMGETFTKWARRNRNLHRVGHMTNEEARDEIRPLLDAPDEELDITPEVD
jgi:hypothetical protein